jgi:hypothetical protein
MRKLRVLLGLAVNPVCSRDHPWVRVWVHNRVQPWSRWRRWPLMDRWGNFSARPRWSSSGLENAAGKGPGASKRAGKVERKHRGRPGRGSQVRIGLSAGGRWIRNFGSWSRDRQTVMGGGLLSKRERICRGTEGSNPVSSSGESGANSTPRFGDQRPVSSLTCESPVTSFRNSRGSGRDEPHCHRRAYSCGICSFW